MPSRHLGVAHGTEGWGVPSMRSVLLLPDVDFSLQRLPREPARAQMLPAPQGEVAGMGPAWGQDGCAGASASVLERSHCRED